MPHLYHGTKDQFQHKTPVQHSALTALLIPPQKRSAARRDTRTVSVVNSTESEPAGCERPPERAVVRTAVSDRVCLDPRVTRVDD